MADQPVTEAQGVPEASADDDTYSWRLVKRPGDPAVQLELGDEFSDWEGPQLTVLVRTIGSALLKAGTMMVQSRVDDDEDWEDE